MGTRDQPVNRAKGVPQSSDPLLIPHLVVLQQLQERLSAALEADLNGMEWGITDMESKPGYKQRLVYLGSIQLEQ